MNSDRPKVLSFVCGRPLIGHVHSVRAGHKMNHRLLSARLSDPSAWRYTSLEAPSVAEPEIEAIAATG